MAKKKQSAGLLMYQVKPDGCVEFLIAHPGGPIFEHKDAGHWGIPKGEFEKNETPLEAALREFEEETGKQPNISNLLPLGSILQKGGKTVYAWAFEGEWEATRVVQCNEIDLEWPPKTGKWHHFPEIDEVRMVSEFEAKRLMREEQFVFVKRLLELLHSQQKLDLGSAQI